jgi:uncharacterized protein YndB with AHSA1/START domain
LLELEADPYRRLAFTWHAFTAELAERQGMSPELFAKIASERRSRVAFYLEPVGQMVKLTVVHDEFEQGSSVWEMVSKGWPQVLSSLKTLLETGEPLNIDSEAARQDRRIGPP